MKHHRRLSFCNVQIQAHLPLKDGKSPCSWWRFRKHQAPSNTSPC